MDEFPETRSSLLLRIRDQKDRRAWSEFVEIYEPVIYRLVRRRGFQHADAEDLTQEALMAVAGAIGRWVPDPGRGTFRGWLFRIARNMMINFLTRARPDQGTGQTAFQKLLEQEAAPAAQDEEAFGREYRTEAFRWAARQVRGEFRDSTWQAFWRTSVDGQSARQTADAIGMSVGAVYAARSRVMARLRRKVEQLEGP